MSLYTPLIWVMNTRTSNSLCIFLRKLIRAVLDDVIQNCGEMCVVSLFIREGANLGDLPRLGVWIQEVLRRGYIVSELQSFSVCSLWSLDVSDNKFFSSLAMIQPGTRYYVSISQFRYVQVSTFRSNFLTIIIDPLNRMLSFLQDTVSMDLNHGQPPSRVSKVPWLK